MPTNSPLYMREYYHRKRREVISLLGGKCAYCGETRYELLEIDHINGHNLKFSPNGSRGGIRNLWDAIKLIRSGHKNEVCILCKTCNILDRKPT